MSEVANIPQLRFPEFSGEWEEKRLGDIAAFSKGKGISKSDIDNDGQLECVRYGELYTTYNELIKDVHSKTNIAKEDVKLSQIGDVIIPASGETAIDIATASCVLKDGVAIGGDLNIIRSDIDGVFNAYYLNNKNKYSVARLSQGSSVIHLYAKHLETLKLNLPIKPEQQKIAAFLTAVDNKIEQLSKKQELLGEYKKGLMQQIFSQAIRFKADDGSEFPDWEEKKLGEFDGLIHGDGDWILSKDITKSGKYEIVQLGNIGFGSFVNKQLKTISKDKFNRINGTLIRKGDLLINRMVDSNLYCCLMNLDGNFITSVDVCWIRDNKYFVNYFLMNLMLFRKNQNKLLNLSSGSGRVRISKRNLFERFSFELPSIEEQTKIANFLSTVDNKIEQVGKQLDESKQFKKALLQQMFV